MNTVNKHHSPYNGFETSNLPLGLTLIQMKTVGSNTIRIYSIVLSKEPLSISIQNGLEHLFYNWFQSIMGESFISLTTFECGALQLICTDYRYYDVVNCINTILSNTIPLLRVDEFFPDKKFVRFPKRFNLNGTAKLLAEFNEWWNTPKE